MEIPERRIEVYADFRRYLRREVQQLLQDPLKVQTRLA
jgi:hypothetical protein